MIASLPMYDWPEVREATDFYWSHLAQSLSAVGLEPPKMLVRDHEGIDHWRDVDLLFSQTCGLPYVTALRSDVMLIGAPAYDIECGAGSYYSVIVVREDAQIDHVAQLEGKCMAINDAHSQSGYCAPLYGLSQAGIDPRSFNFVLSGAHRQSLKAVAAGHADFAAIDAVTFEMALRHEPEAKKVRILARTKPTPVLPYISSNAFADQHSCLFAAITEAMISLPESVRSALCLAGFVPLQDSDYNVIAQQWQNLQDQGLDQLAG